MFEGFSFPSPSSIKDDDDRVMLDCDDAMISPLSSRPSSPSPMSRQPGHPLWRPRTPPYRRRPQPQPPTSNPTTYDPYHHRRISVTMLTEKLHAHSLAQNLNSRTNSETPLSPSPSPLNFASATASPIVEQEENGGIALLTPPGEFDDEAPSSPPPLLSRTSIPASDPDFLSPDDALLLSSAARNHRSPRHRPSSARCSVPALDLVRRQSLLLAESADARRRASGSNDPLSLEECHPSSLPADRSPPRRRRRPSTSTIITAPRGRSPEVGARRRSTSAVTAPLYSSANRVGKVRPNNASHRDLHSRRNEQSFRRKSLVSAALELSISD
ncbi:hypothetical protein VTN31DRAFT_5194 [Thermomyces dupontii]|uniref:uncharacterized protein n=1 Tax=Talaromyces thermophilus TaxID=28565 RepID=UPI003743E8A2